jgi:hypothetical protein
VILGCTLFLGTTGNPYFLLASLAIPVSVLLFRSDEFAILVIIASLFLLDWLSVAMRVMPAQVAWLPDLIIALLVMKALYRKVTGRYPSEFPIAHILIALVAIALVSTILNGVNGLTVLSGVRRWYKYVLLCYLMGYLDLRESFLRKAVWVIVCLTLLQGVITVLQSVFFLGVEIPDLISGTMGRKVSGVLVLLSLGVMCLLIGFLDQRIRRKIVMGGIPLLLLPAMTSEVKVGFFFFPLLVAYFVIVGPLRRGARLVVLVPIFSVLFFLLILLYNANFEFGSESPAGSITEYLTSPSKVWAYETGYTTYEKGTANEHKVIGRFDAIKFSHSLVSRRWTTLLVGLGPGNASESFFGEYSGKYYRDYPYRIDRTFVSSVILEYGYLGLVVFALLLARLYAYNRRAYEIFDSKFWKAVSIGFGGIVFLVVVSSVYNSFIVKIDSTSFLFWFVCGCIFRVTAASRRRYL